MADLSDRRLASSLRRASVVEIERMLVCIAGFTVQHFHEPMVKRHNYVLRYTVQVDPRREGLVQPVKKRSAQSGAAVDGRNDAASGSHGREACAVRGFGGNN